MTYHQQSETPKDRWHTPKRRGGEATDRPCNVDWNGIHLTTSKWQLAILNSRAHILTHSLTGQAWTKACNHLWTATIMVWQVMTACTHLRCILQFVNVRITPSTNSLDCSLSFCFFSSLSLVYAMINLSTTFCIVSKTSCIPALIEHEHLICLHLQLQKPHTCTCTPITIQCMEELIWLSQWTCMPHIFTFSCLSTVRIIFLLLLALCNSFYWTLTRNLISVATNTKHAILVCLACFSFLMKMFSYRIVIIILAPHNCESIL